MAVGVLVQPPYLHFFTDAGAPLALGTVEIYAAGTVNPLPLYSDQALTVSLGTTITLNSAGVLQGYLDPRLAYKFIVKTSGGALVRTQDTMRFAAPSTTTDEPDRLTILSI